MALRHGLAIRRTGTIPGGLDFFFYNFFLLLYNCLPNVLKRLFPNSPFDNKSLIVNRLDVTDNALARSRSAPLPNRFDQSNQCERLSMELKRTGGAEKQNYCSGFQVQVRFICKYAIVVLSSLKILYTSLKDIIYCKVTVVI